MKPSVAVLDYGIGNLRSAQKALMKQGANAELTDEAEKILKADGVVLPGVGHFGTCMKALSACGLDSVIKEAIQRQKPFLGFCIGMQLLYESSAEAPDVAGLSILDGEISLLPDGVRRPQIQWNQIRVLDTVPVLEGLDKSWMYFVHSYIPPMDEFCVATSSYGGEFCAVVAKPPIIATQFHPEKSGEAGLALLDNFVRGL